MPDEPEEIEQPNIEPQTDVPTQPAEDFIPETDDIQSVEDSTPEIAETQPEIETEPEPEFEPMSEIETDNNAMVDEVETVSTEEPPVASPVIETSPTQQYESQPIVNPGIQENGIKTPKPKNKLLLIILAAIIVCLGGGSVLAYNFWYQNPEKMISDAIVGAITAESSVYTGTLEAESSGTTAKVEVTAKKSGFAAGSLESKLTITNSGETYTFNGNALYDKSGNIFVKFENIKSIVDNVVDKLVNTSAGPTAGSTAISSAISTIVDKIDGTWIKISSEDISQYNSEYAKFEKCVSTATVNFNKDKSGLNEISAIYKKNPFIIIDEKLGEKDGSQGFRISGDETKSKAFVTDLSNSKIFTALKGCNSQSITLSTDPIENIAPTSGTTGGTIEIWVNSWSHQLTKVTMNIKDGSSKSSATIIPSFNQKVEITAPTKFMTISELKSDIEGLIMTIMTQTFSPIYDCGTTGTDNCSGLSDVTDFSTDIIDR